MDNSLLATELAADLRRPSVELLRRRLAQRNDMPSALSDLVTYACGFTHFAEAGGVLEEFGLEIAGNPPVLLDHSARECHVKILFADVSNVGGQAAVSGFSDELAGPVHTIEVDIRDPDGNWISGLQTPDELPRVEGIAWQNRCTLGLNELNASARGRLAERREWNAVCHFAQAWPPNAAFDVSRVFRNATYVIVEEVSHPRMSREPLSHLCLPPVDMGGRGAVWLIAESADADNTAARLEEAGVEHRRIGPFEPAGIWAAVKAQWEDISLPK
ncbi:MAG TPA: hypothetical protein VGM37_12295 [Armatimonadota bacterium]|jgi:hypothetical protein